MNNILKYYIQNIIKTVILIYILVFGDIFIIIPALITYFIFRIKTDIIIERPKQNNVILNISIIIINLIIIIISILISYRIFKFIDKQYIELLINLIKLLQEETGINIIDEMIKK